jgi:hypothetical protein
VFGFGHEGRKDSVDDGSKNETVSDLHFGALFPFVVLVYIKRNIMF